LSLALTEEHRKIVRDILSAHLPEGVSVRAFGSRVEGRHRPLSDLDLALKGPRPLSFAELADLAEAFSESDLPFKVDLVDLKAAEAAFCERVERDGVEL
jgi:predicted nucleotidyltransferase